MSEDAALSRNTNGIDNSELVTSKTIYARIDRPARLVSFKRPADADDVLNEWSGNMKSLLGLLERIDHLITKESVLHTPLASCETY